MVQIALNSLVWQNMHLEENCQKCMKLTVWERKQSENWVSYKKKVYLEKERKSSTSHVLVIYISNLCLCYAHKLCFRTSLNICIIIVYFKLCIRLCNEPHNNNYYYYNLLYTYKVKPNAGTMPHLAPTCGCPCSGSFCFFL